MSTQILMTGTHVTLYHYMCNIVALYVYYCGIICVLLWHYLCNVVVS